MSDVFDDRKQGFEAKYKMDQETRFKATAKRNRMLGLWAAELFGLSPDDAQSFASQVVEADLEEVGDDDVKRFLMAAFQSHGVELSEETLDDKLEEFFDRAMAEIRRQSS